VRLGQYDENEEWPAGEPYPSEWGPPYDIGPPAPEKKGTLETVLDTLNAAASTAQKVLKPGGTITVAGPKPAPAPELTTKTLVWLLGGAAVVAMLLMRKR
jgi:hypothetical protein